MSSLPNRIGTALALALASASASMVGAQTGSAPVAVGSRVRVQTLVRDTARTFVGNLTAWESDTIRLRTSAAVEQRIPLAQVRRLDVSRGKGIVASHVLIGAGAGALAGAVIGGAVGSSSRDEGMFSDLNVAAGALVGGLAGGVGGAVIGMAIKGERWKQVGLERPAVGVLPLRGRTVVVLSARF